MSLIWELGTYTAPSKSTNGLYVVRSVAGGSRGPAYIAYFRPDAIFHHAQAIGELRDSIAESHEDCEVHFAKLQEAA